MMFSNTLRSKLFSMARIGGAACLASLSCILSLLAAPALADGNQIPIKYYVSKLGDNSDGKSWQTAWNEMDQIKWTLINTGRGDSLTIDGGTSRMIYSTPMRIQTTNSQFPLQIKVSAETGHNGVAVIAGARQNACGVEMVSGSVNLSGTRKGGLAVANWGLDGVLIPQGFHTNVEYLDLYRNSRSGLHITGGFNLSARKCIVHDNFQDNILVDPPSTIMSVMDKCWVYNTSYLITSNGIKVGNGTTNPSMFCSNCVIGPGLKNGFRFLGATSFGGSLNNCLLINATKSNISTVKGLQANKVTSFMTRLNPVLLAHDCVTVQAALDNPPGTDGISNSVFFGGVVRVPSNIPFHTINNTQFRTTGNTMFLSDAQVDPQFVTNVGAYSNLVTIQKLINTDFSLKPESPAAGTGSDITSVAQLLSMF